MHVGYSRDGEELRFHWYQGNLTSKNKYCEIQIPKSSQFCVPDNILRALDKYKTKFAFNGLAKKKS